MHYYSNSSKQDNKLLRERVTLVWSMVGASYFSQWVKYFHLYCSRLLICSKISRDVGLSWLRSSTPSLISCILFEILSIFLESIHRCRFYCRFCCRLYCTFYCRLESRFYCKFYLRLCRFPEFKID